MNLKECKVIGGIGEKKSNGGTQYFQQDRIYSMGDICLCLPANIPYGSYKFLEISKINKDQVQSWIKK